MPVPSGRLFSTQFLALELPCIFCASLRHRCRDEKGEECLGTPIIGWKETQTAETFRGHLCSSVKAILAAGFPSFDSKYPFDINVEKKASFTHTPRVNEQTSKGATTLSPRSDKGLELWTLTDMLKNYVAIKEREQESRSLHRMTLPWAFRSLKQSVLQQHS